jgi:carbonic anhydrase
MRLSLSIAALLALPGLPALGETGAHHHWAYSGHDGPPHWAEMDQAYRACSAGHSQSPINIHRKDARARALPSLVFDYRPSPLEIIDNGHTVQVNYAPGSALIIGGRRYELVQFHFHHPAEEAFDGRHFDMVVHLVHKDSEGQLAVVAIPLKSGHDNPLIKALWTNLPKEGDHQTAHSKIAINAEDLIPMDHHYYAYSGSLTTPPCSEGVRWTVLRTPIEVSKAQIAAFAKRYPDDARPLQQLNGREVLVSR